MKMCGRVQHCLLPFNAANCRQREGRHLDLGHRLYKYTHIQLFRLPTAVHIVTDTQTDRHCCCHTLLPSTSLTPQLLHYIPRVQVIKTVNDGFPFIHFALIFA